MQNKTRSKTKPKTLTKTKTKASQKAKTVVKSKVKSCSGVKPPFSGVNFSSLDINPPDKTVTTRSKGRKYWILGLVLVSLMVLIYLLCQLSQSWLIKSSLSQTRTYPYASVLGMRVGDLDNEQLNKQLSQMKSEFENRRITLTNNKNKWTFGYNNLGVTLDTKSTSKAVWRLNSLSLAEKYRLLTGVIKSMVTPTILVDNEKCVKSLSAIHIPQMVSRDALIYYDQGLKIKPDQSGTKFSAASNCRELSKWAMANSSVASVYLNTTPATLTRAELESTMPKIEAIVTKSLYLHSSNYHLTLTSKQLFALLEINKKKTSVQVEWSSTKLDELISNIAARVDTYNNSPILGSCQFLVSTGGYWLDRVATKNFLQSIVANSSRSYSLPITYHAAIVGKRTQLAVGSNGTIFLTFDDGLSYGNQIMDYASCYGVKVTFFELGSRVGIDSATLRRAVAEGHAIQSHGYLHAAYDYGSRSYDWQFNDIKQSINAIASVTGIVPTYFRPPGGNRSAETYKAASANGLTLILWGASSSDTAGISSDAICANVLASVHPGASVLMHSTKPTTAEAVPCIMEGMAAKGYNMQALR